MDKDTQSVALHFVTGIYTKAGVSSGRKHDEDARERLIDILWEIKNVGIDGRRLHSESPTDRHLEAHIPMSRSTQQTVLTIVQEELLRSGLNLVLRNPERTFERAHGYDWPGTYERVWVGEAEQVELEGRVDRFAGGCKHEVEAVVLALGVS